MTHPAAKSRTVGNQIADSGSDPASATLNVLNGTLIDDRSNAPAAEMPRARQFAYAVILAAFTGASLAAIYSARPLASANDRSRWCTVWSLVERGTFQIDEITTVPGWDTIDKVHHEGHFYSSKPPLLPTLVAGLYWAIKQVTGLSLLHNSAVVTRLILVLINLVPMLLALVLLVRMLERYSAYDGTRYFVVTAAAFATFLTTFLVTFNNHTLAAVSVIFALYPAAQILAGGSRCPGHFALAGFFAAFTCTNEIPAALFGLLLFGMLIQRAPRQTLVYFVPAAIVPLAAYFAATLLQTGGWKPFYAFYGTDKYRYEIDGIPSYWMQPKGIDQGLDSFWSYLFHCTVGHHGIFSLSPIFILTVYSWTQMRNWRNFPLRGFLWMGLLLSVVTLGFYLTRAENYNYGGVTSGLRWMFWLIPFWLIALIPLLDRYAACCRWMRASAVLFLVASTFSAWYPINNPWQHPWLFQLAEHWGLIDFSTPPPVLDPPPTTWFRSLPPANSSAWIEFLEADVDGNTTRLRLEEAGTVDDSGRTLRRIVVRWTPGQSAAAQAPGSLEPNGTSSVAATSRTYVIDADIFGAGGSVSEFLRWPEGDPNPVALAEAERILGGLPLEQTYRGRETRYLKTPLRTNAFSTVLAVAQGDFQAAGASQPLRYRVDVWLTDEVPFGVLKKVTSVSDPRTGAVIARRESTIVATSSLPTAESNTDR